MQAGTARRCPIPVRPRSNPDQTHLQHQRVVEDDLGVGDAQLQHLVVHLGGRLQGAERLLQVRIERPQLDRPGKYEVEQYAVSQG